MPELPEVETTRRGLCPLLVGRRVTGVTVREPRLRWPVPDDLGTVLTGQAVRGIGRRAKYLLFQMDAGTLIAHLGMSGSLCVVDAGTPPGPHDHVDIAIEGGTLLRLRDPRRFGSLHWTVDDPAGHPLLRDLGPEPLGDAFDGRYLFRRSRGRQVVVKAFLMDSHIVVGVGNIYAAEALFAAGIHPARAAGRVGGQRYDRLARAVRSVLAAAIQAGGTTLRDFRGGDGRPGYFQQTLSVYGRAGKPCPRCGTAIELTRQGQRATCHCPACQR